VFFKTYGLGERTGGDEAGFSIFGHQTQNHDPDSDPNSPKSLDPDPESMTMAPQECFSI
jgi:hypothetical protein